MNILFIVDFSCFIYIILAINFSVNTSLNNTFSINNEKIKAILSEISPLFEPSPLLPEGK